MKQIVVASTNPVKTEAARLAFAAVFPGEAFAVESVGAKSNVADQPMTDEETLRGALNRVDEIAQVRPEADYWVGIEGGIEIKDKEMVAFAWAVVRDRDRQGKGRTGEFFLPARLKELVEGGMELGQADDIVFGRTESGRKNGSVGLLTRNAITRTEFHKQAVILALVAFAHPELYPV